MSVSITNRMKAIAIILVVIGHIASIYFGANAFMSIIMGTGGVSTFLVLSGYGVTMSYYKKGLEKSYWDNKINKVLIPYWIITIAYYIIFFYGKISFVSLVDNMLLIDYKRTIDGTMWYLFFLIIIYISIQQKQSLTILTVILI